ncbi:MAG: CAP domain-containing protein [Planctomycetota bacterium]
MSPTFHAMKRLGGVVELLSCCARRGDVRRGDPAAGPFRGVEPLEPRLLLSAGHAEAAAVGSGQADGTGVVAAGAPDDASSWGEPVGDVAWSPTPDEQEMLEWLNDMRMDPAGHLWRMVDSIDPLHSPDPMIQSALTYFEVDGLALQAEWAALAPADPLIWNSALMQAARDHSQVMIDHDTQSHQLPGEPSLGQRVSDAGYTSFSMVAENIFAYAETIPYGHAGFAIDWGWPDPDGDGMQDPPGHRENMINSALREVGIGILEENDDQTQVGPLVVTQDFGNRWGFDTPYLTGVVYSDADGDGLYDAGEGLGGATVAVTGGGGTVYATTMAAGGYQIPVDAGEYTVEFSYPGYAPVSGDAVTTVGHTTKADGIMTDAAAAVLARHVFYNNSALDGSTPGPAPQDDNAIAADKQALMPGEPAGAANRTAYGKGLNGIMVDIDGLADPVGLSLATIGDYVGFQVATGDDPSTWAPAPAPTAVDVRTGDGADGSDRVTIIFDDGAIADAWLEVTVRATAATGLAGDDVFYVATLPGDADASGAVDLDDFVILKQSFGGSGGGIPSGDFDLSDTVDLDDFVILKQRFGNALNDPTTAVALSLSGADASATPARPHKAPAARHVRARRIRGARHHRSAALPPTVDLLAAARLGPLA